MQDARARARAAESRTILIITGLVLIILGFGTLLSGNLGPRAARADAFNRAAAHWSGSHRALIESHQFSIVSTLANIDLEQRTVVFTLLCWSLFPIVHGLLIVLLDLRIPASAGGRKHYDWTLRPIWCDTSRSFGLFPVDCS
jgi:hypothetical protein